MNVLKKNKFYCLFAVLVILLFAIMVLSSGCASAPEPKPTDNKAADTNEEVVEEEDVDEEDIIEEASEDVPEEELQAKETRPEKIKGFKFPEGLNLPEHAADLEKIRVKYNKFPEATQNSKEGVGARELIFIAATLTRAQKLKKADKAIIQAKNIIDNIKIDVDKDKDGVADAQDLCPEAAAADDSPYKKWGCNTGELGFASIAAFDAEGKAVTGVKASGFGETLKKIESGDVLTTVGAPGEYTLNVKKAGKKAPVNIKIEKDAKSYYNVTLK